jgi:hypothetical protein
VPGVFGVPDGTGLTRGRPAAARPWDVLDPVHWEAPIVSPTVTETHERHRIGGREVRGNGTPPASPFRPSEFEHQSRRDLSGQDLLEAGVDVLDPADVGDNSGAARGVQLEYLRDVKPRADDRADD